MSDPKRLLDSEAADPEVRELLQSMRALKPGTGAALGSWGAMAAKVATLPSIVPPPAAAPVAPHAAAAGISHALALKVAAVVIASGLVGGGIYWQHASERAQATPASAATVAGIPAASPMPTTTPAAAPADSSAAATSVPNEAVAEADDLAPVTATQAPASAAARISRLDAEASLLSKVRAALRSGDAHGALAALSQLQAQFPKGALGQERDVLAIEVLAANGNVAAAKRKAAAFIAAHPSSPHSAKLERFLEAQ